MKKRKDLFSEENQVAKEYDLLKLAVPHHDEFQGQVFQILKKLNKRKKLRVLELGSGTGITTVEILKALPDAKVDCVDLESGMIGQAKEKGVKGDITFVHSDILDFLKAQVEKGVSYDIVVSAYTLHNLNFIIRNRILALVYKILVKKGLFINADKIAHADSETYRNIYNQQIEMYMVFDSLGLSDLRREWIDHYTKDDQPDILLKEDEYKNSLRKIGFCDIETVYRVMLETVIVCFK